jgi:hypothetical protein
LLCDGDSESQSPSFPHAFNGNPGELDLDPIKSLEGDNFGKTDRTVFGYSPVCGVVDLFILNPFSRTRFMNEYVTVFEVEGARLKGSAFDASFD